MIVNEVNVTERGWAGHFILADRCLFRRNTLLEYKDKKWIVSTVGAYRNRENKMDSIGYRRWYETMAFEAQEKFGYIDANTENKISFDSQHHCTFLYAISMFCEFIVKMRILT